MSATNAQFGQGEINTKHLCQLCEEQLVTIYCKNCTRALCKNCTKVHIKTIPDCAEETVIEMSSVQVQQQASFASLEQDIVMFENKQSTELEKMIQAHRAEEKEVLRMCQQTKTEVLDRVDEHFSSQENKIKELNADEIKSLEGSAKERLGGLNKLLSQVRDLRQKDGVEQAATWEASVESIKKTIEGFSQVPHVNSYGYIVCNLHTGRAAFDESKAFSVAWGIVKPEESRIMQQQRGASELEGFEWLSSGPLKLLHMTEIYGTVEFMLVVENTLWCLLPDRIIICDSNGKVMKKTGMKLLMSACAMTQLDDIVVVRCHEANGLFVFKKNGNYVGCFTNISYYSICGHGDILVAVKHEKNYGSNYAVPLVSYKWDKEAQELTHHISASNLSADSRLTSIHVVHSSNGELMYGTDDQKYEDIQLYSIPMQPADADHRCLKISVKPPSKIPFSNWKIQGTHGNKLLLVTFPLTHMMVYDVCTGNISEVVVPDDARGSKCLAVSSTARRMYVLVQGTLTTPNTLHIYNC